MLQNTHQMVYSKNKEERLLPLFFYESSISEIPDHSFDTESKIEELKPVQN